MKGLEGERGISIVVGVILVIAVFIAAFIVFYPLYSRLDLYKAEAKHMNSVRESFLEIKSGVEKMSEGDTLSFEVQMSAAPHSLSLWAGRSGTLSVTSASENMYGTLEFMARNMFQPSRTYVFEGGGVIMMQEGVATMISEPTMITVRDLKEEEQIRWVWVDVHHILIENWEFMVASKGVRTLMVTCVSSRYVENAGGRPNRENVVVNLKDNVKPGHKEAWKKYLESVKEGLPGYYNITLDPENLKLLIEGFYKYPDENKDIFYYERVTEIRVRVI